MATRRTHRPLSSFLLRVAEVREEHVVIRYELHDLRAGTVRTFTSLAALARFIGRRRATTIRK